MLLNNCTRPGRLCILILFSCLVSGCAHAPVPDLQRLYETRSLKRDTAIEPGAVETPVILVHGVFGARLRDRETGEEVWPGGVTSLLFNSYDDIALTIDADTLQPAASSLEACITGPAAGGEVHALTWRPGCRPASAVDWDRSRVVTLTPKFFQCRHYYDCSLYRFWH